ncbi:MAG: Uncharacterised protein [Hyphomonas sp. TMED17]|nr:MAG: Uncharacterised protein [Hyphomonas sp. TMED17]
MSLVTFGDIGFTQSRQYGRRKARSVIKNCHHNLAIGPAHFCGDETVGKTHGIFDKGPDSVQYLGTPANHRRLFISAINRNTCNFDFDSQPAMRRRRFFNKGAQRHLRMYNIIGLLCIAELPQYISTALGLLAQKRDIFTSRIAVFEIPIKFLGNQVDRRQRRPEFMCGHCRHRAECRQTLFARNDNAGRIKRPDHFLFILTQPLDRPSRKGNSNTQRCEMSCFEQDRQNQLLAATPWQLKHH